MDHWIGPLIVVVIGAVLGEAVLVVLVFVWFISVALRLGPTGLVEYGQNVGKDWEETDEREAEGYFCTNLLHPREVYPWHVRQGHVWVARGDVPLPILMMHGLVAFMTRPQLWGITSATLGVLWTLR